MTLSNKLTLSRIIIVPFFISFMSLDSLYAYVIALVIFIFASLTDLYDGYIARRLGQVTVMGKFLDPLADKMIVTAALISFVRFKELAIPAWLIIVIIFREFIINDLRDLAVSNKVVIAVSKAGKFKTVMQMTSIIIILLLIILKSVLGNPDWYGLFLHRTSFWMMFIVMLITVATGLDYLFKGAKMLVKSNT